MSSKNKLSSKTLEVSAKPKLGMLKRAIFNRASYLRSMAIAYIAFIECVLQPNGHWNKISFGHGNLNPQPHFDAYRPSGKDAEMRLVDIKNDRRYFKFHNHDASIRLVNNVVIFDNDDVEELAIDDSKKFPNRKRMDQ
jgi:hypothetical protein